MLVLVSLFSEEYIAASLRRILLYTAISKGGGSLYSQMSLSTNVTPFPA